jgi:selenocysteine lyase/cysteine desulfurase
MDRRSFLLRSGLTIGGAALATARSGLAAQASEPAAPRDWAWVRQQFATQPGYAHFAGFFLSTHPRPVREAIERYRIALDANPVRYWIEHRTRHEADVAVAAAEYLGVEAEDIALTDSTTMGLGLTYSGLRIREDQQILTSDHDHYSTRTAIDFRAVRTPTQIVRTPLYQRSAAATADEIVDSVVRYVTPSTRVVALTWVHSKTGLRIPVRAIADALAPFNRGRSEDDRILLCIDGVHGMGAVPGAPKAMGCDFFIAGTHKWIFGPRGTGLVWGRPDAWPHATPTIPPFGPHDPPGSLHTPGGFHSFEHRWAVNEAFHFHGRIGKHRVYDRVRELNQQIKEGLAPMAHVTLHTPMDPEISAGICCFEVAGLEPPEAVAGLYEKNIVASVSPYDPPYVRLSAGLLNDEQEVEAALRAVRSLG